MFNACQKVSVLPTEGEVDPTSYTTSPLHMGASVIGLKYKDGVLIAADRQVCYGSMQRFKSLQRIFPITKNVVMGSGGEYSDLQAIVRKLKETELEDWAHHDGNQYSARDYYNLLTRMSYKQRNKMDPLWCSSVVAGVSEDGDKFLGLTDYHGTHYEGNFVVTGLANYFVKAIIENNWNPDIEKADAIAILEKCLRVLFYRECKASDYVQFADVTSAGVQMGEPYRITSTWDHQEFLHPRE
eukprot:CAMPEP_0114973824 /NCGR_PEP_ID=MMETSP0216-20121206/1179_1 /TAXON_ID=223996 /ORGANISM="Protocruzia adherens, Strain Boccale" /LENGTH=240 /DNA_ID=CAMNT_0002334379 /DNA_START=62 /DNA_END=784 /DNA_ORIENTATION=+